MQSAFHNSVFSFTRQRVFVRILRFAILFGLLVLCLGAQSTNDTHLPSKAGIRFSKEIETCVLSGQWESAESLIRALPQTENVALQISPLIGYVALSQDRHIEAQYRFFAAGRLPNTGSWLSWTLELQQRYPRNAVAHFLAGDALARLGKWPDAVVSLNTALSLNPKLALARLVRATVKAINGEGHLAIADANQLIADNILIPEALTLRGIVRISEGRPEEAWADLDQAASLMPDSAITLNARGVAQAQAKNLENAMHDFEIAFRLAPQLTVARHNWQVAKGDAKDRGVDIPNTWNMGIIGTGILNEADLDFARRHAESLVPGRPQAYLYVAFEGATQPSGVKDMQRQGFQTVVIPAEKVQGNLPATPILNGSVMAIPSLPSSFKGNIAAGIQIASFIKTSVAEGKNPVLFVDINKWVPHQLGNSKPAAEEVPARIAVLANEMFHHEVARIGGQAYTTMAGHSDFTWAETKASALAGLKGVPFDRVILESPRSEAAVRQAVSASPNTQFTVVQPVKGDLFTIEAQTRAASGLGGMVGGLVPGNSPNMRNLTSVQEFHNAYGATIDTFKSIGASNYRLLLIENTTPNGLGFVPMAHGDPAQYNRYSEVSVWHGGKQIDSKNGVLGEAVNHYSRSVTLPTVSPNAPKSVERGGIRISPVYMARTEGGRVVFQQSGGPDKGFRLAYMLFPSLVSR